MADAAPEPSGEDPARSSDPKPSEQADGESLPHPETIPPGPPRTSGTIEHTFRTLPSLILGWIMLAAGLVIAVTFLVSVGGSDAVTPVAVCLAVSAGAWVTMVRPCVLLKSDGLVLRNLVTDVDVPFGHLASVGSKWALEVVDTGGGQHSSWAIPARKGLRSQMKDEDDAAVGKSGFLGNNAAAVAGVIADGWDDWREAGGRAVTTEHPVRRAPAPAAVAPLSLGIVLLVAAIVF